MNDARQTDTSSRQARLFRTLGAAVITAALCLGTTACSDDLLGSADPGVTPAEKTGERAKSKLTEKSVRAFYARASKAYRTGNARQLCRMTQPAFAANMIKQAAASGLDVSTCPEVWRVVFQSDPDGYKDKISKVQVKGRTATFLSGNDPWRLRLIDGEWRIVRS
jgi:hypothetical protein